MKKYLTIHGHFYQPPRENPWTEAIDRQPGAYPEHDWNEKINAECYFPNGFSRILDSHNRITEIVNNYSKINFDFGPTLLSWLEEQAPAVYQRILQADREGAAQNNGHGPAIAQAYNHIILPLAPVEDQHTQIRWGIADFRHRFKREPESIWLPETAIDQTTLNILTGYPFKYIILSPYQAQRIRSLNGDHNDWQTVEDGHIDSRRAYRCFARDENGEKIAGSFIDIFFYNGNLARAISFEDLLQDGKNLADRVDEAFGQGDGAQLVSIATDGESYGHHKRFGDMALAYLLHVEAQAREMTPITYGAFLEMHPPQLEVELKAGPDGEGTAWSCAHGVGRWYRDCGCHTGGELHWNQAWRFPLRQALDNLRDALRELTFSAGSELLENFAEARDDYIQAILDRSEAAMLQFFEKHAAHPLSESEKHYAIALMEIERQIQLMYTSCGWFFNELSGIETVQIIKYAARAIQVAESISDRNFENRFLEDLKQAKSNIPEYRDGEWIYQNLVKPLVVSFSKVAGHFAICSALEVIKNQKKRHEVYIYNIETLDYQLAEQTGQKLHIGKVRVSSKRTFRRETIGYALLHSSIIENVKCATKSLQNDADYEQAKSRLLQRFADNHADFDEAFLKNWGDALFSLGDIFYDERESVAETIVKNQLGEVAACAEEIFDKSRGIITILSGLGLPLPEEIVQPAKITLSNIILTEVAKLRHVADVAQYEKAVAAADTARKMQISLLTDKAARLFQKKLARKLGALQKNFKNTDVQKLTQLIEVAERLQLELHYTPIQNYLYAILQQQVNPAIEKIVRGEGDDALYEAVNSILRIAYRLNFNITHYKDRLDTFEQPVSQDPSYWP
jgi:alpha-amylase/alpha-mannosidase (GH57 family)